MNTLGTPPHSIMSTASKLIATLAAAALALAMQAAIPATATADGIAITGSSQT